MIVIAGICTFLNLVIILSKFRRCRIIDALVDLLLFAVVCVLTSGSYAGMCAGMVASVLVSLYLALFPMQKKSKKNHNTQTVKAGLLH